MTINNQNDEQDGEHKKLSVLLYSSNEIQSNGEMRHQKTVNIHFPLYIQTYCLRRFDIYFVCISLFLRARFRQSLTEINQTIKNSSCGIIIFSIHSHDSSSTVSIPASVILGVWAHMIVH